MFSVIKNYIEFETAPHQSTLLTASPEGKPWNKADNFCLIVRKHDEARGSREAADNFCLIVREHDEARGSLDEGRRQTE